jgi:hypothetical protein
MADSQTDFPKPEWRYFLAIGIVLIIQTWFDITPGGPWESRSFSRGILGLCGLALIYLSWFRFTFERTDRVIPTLNLWKTPSTSVHHLALSGAVFVLMAWIIGGLPNGMVPEPTGLLLNLFGLLMLLQALYVYLVISGILADSNEEE